MFLWISGSIRTAARSGFPMELRNGWSPWLRKKDGAEAAGSDFTGKAGVEGMNIQIFGRSKCFDTQKAERYFKERKIKYQRIDLNQYGLSKGELESVKAAVELNALFRREAKEYTALNLHIIRSDSMREELLLKNPKLYASPIVRNGKQATVGYQPEVWKSWEL